MPIRYRVDRAVGCIFTTAEGTLTDEELLEHARRLEEDPEADPRCDEVIDVRKVRGVGPSSGAVRETASILRGGERLEKGARLAIVATSEAGFGTGRMFEALSGDPEERVRTFRGMEEALAWLGIAGPTGGES